MVGFPAMTFAKCKHELEVSRQNERSEWESSSPVNHLLMAANTALGRVPVSCQALASGFGQKMTAGFRGGVTVQTRTNDSEFHQEHQNKNRRNAHHMRMVLARAHNILLRTLGPPFFRPFDQMIEAEARSSFSPRLIRILDTPESVRDFRLSPSETSTAALRAKIHAVCGIMGSFHKGACGRSPCRSCPV